MGKCVICDKETDNCYNFYTATLIDRQTSVRRETLVKTTTTVTKYTNIIKHNEYLCTKCAWKTYLFNNRFQSGKAVKLSFVAFAVSLLILIFFFLGGSDISGMDNSAITMLAMAFIVCVIAILLCVLILRSSFADTELKTFRIVGSNALASNALIESIKAKESGRKTNDEVTLFFPDNPNKKTDISP